jgi:hypothetical protein
MKWMIYFLTFFSISITASAQNGPVKHPRVIELEDKLTEEASLYFSRRHPSEPFFVKIEVEPLRRKGPQGAMSDSLPYFDQDSEEAVDEWDDPTTPLSFLRNRVIRVKVNVSVPEKFDDTKVTEIKQEIPIYLNLLPSRDEVTVERKFKTIDPKTPDFVYYIFGSLIISSILIGLMVRWSVSKMKTPALAAGSSPGAAAMTSAPSQGSNSGGRGGKVSTAVSGDVTFHDPIKTLEIVHIKIKQLSDSGTFPTLKDIILLNDFCQKDPRAMGAVIYELPSEWQKTVFQMGHGQNWLEAFSNPGQIHHDALMILDQMARQRTYTAGDRAWEDLLIQLWRLEDKSINFFKGTDQDHAFFILSLLPKSLSLRVAKKCFPGSWGRLLETKPQNLVIDSKVLNQYLVQALEIVPLLEWKILDEYNKDKEMISYLDVISIEDERDIYETLKKDSFIFKIRPPFYKVFELPAETLGQIVYYFSLEQWALAVVNSSRQYIKSVSDHLDDKKKIIFSSHLKRLDHNPPSLADQSNIRLIIAKYADETYLSKKEELKTEIDTNSNEELNEKSA